jgi:cell division protein FtsW
VSSAATVADTRSRFGMDHTLLASVMCLLAIGIAMVFSASFVVAEAAFGDDTYFLTRHIIWVSIGFVGMLVIARIDYHRWQPLAMPLYILSIVLLAVVLLIPSLSKESYGAARWISITPSLSFQPSELAKLAMVLYVSAWITRVGSDISKLTFGTIPFAIIVAIPAVLVLREPDLGTTIVLVLAAASMAFMAGANVLHALAGAVLVWFLAMENLITSGWRADRIKAWIDPWADPGGFGWHTIQTLIALGSGGWFGLGLGASRQKYSYVPNAHTDSIFAIVGEEMGLIGTALILGLFLIVAWRGLTIACAVKDPLGRMLAAGTTLLIAWQAMLNMAVVSNVVPNTGVPLPFVSYGGSSAVVSLAAVGILLNISRTVDPQRRTWRAWLSGAPEPPPVAPEPLPERGVRTPRLPAPAPAAFAQPEPATARPARARRPRKLTPTRR